MCESARFRSGRVADSTGQCPPEWSWETDYVQPPGRGSVAAPSEREIFADLREPYFESAGGGSRAHCGTNEGGRGTGSGRDIERRVSTSQDRVRKGRVTVGAQASEQRVVFGLLSRTLAGRIGRVTPCAPSCGVARPTVSPSPLPFIDPLTTAIV